MTLLPHQVIGAERAVTAVRRFGGALLCDRVGTGKSRMALEAARQLLGDAQCIVVVGSPATKQAWVHEARQLEVHVIFVSWAELSRRASRPVSGPAVWVVDEAHHMRHPGIARSDTLAMWVGVDPVLLLTATPIVNGAADVEHLVGLFASRAPLTCVETWEQVVVRASPVPSSTRVRRVCNGPSPDSATSSALDAGALAAAYGVSQAAALLRAQLWRRWSSAPEAALMSVRRLRRYFDAALSAAVAGRVVPRGALASCLDGPVQASFSFVWSTAAVCPDVEAVRSARAILEQLEQRLRQQRWSDWHGERLASAFVPGVPTLAFAECVETAVAVGRALDRRGHRALVVTGSGARGSSFGLMSVEDGLSLFAKGHPAVRVPPDVLVCTSVAAEGHNLQRARRVVHLDIPWNPARLEQRVGRADRIGGVGSVEEVVLLPAPAVCERVDAWTLIGRKSRWVQRWNAGEYALWAERVPRETAWPPCARRVDEVLAWARTLQRAGQPEDARRLVELVVPAWASTPGRARQRAWPGVSAGVDRAVEWARYSAGPCPVDSTERPEPSGAVHASS